MPSTAAATFRSDEFWLSGHGVTRAFESQVCGVCQAVRQVVIVGVGVRGGPLRVTEDRSHPSRRDRPTFDFHTPQDFLDVRDELREAYDEDVALANALHLQPKKDLAED